MLALKSSVNAPFMADFFGYLVITNRYHYRALMKPATQFQSIFLALVICLLTACANSTPKPLIPWQNSQYSGEINNLLIVAAISRSTQRRVWEDLYVTAFADTQTNPIPSYQKATISLNLSRRDFESAIISSQLDTVLMTRLIGVADPNRSNSETSAPAELNLEATNQASPSSIKNPDEDYLVYYETALAEANSSYYRKFRELALEVKLYDAKTRRVIWSIQSSPIERTVPRNLLEQHIGIILKYLAASGLIKLEA